MHLLCTQDHSVQLQRLDEEITFQQGDSILTEVSHKFTADALEELLQEIRKVISDYMLLMRRTEKIPKSDIIKIVDNVESVDSVYVEFITEEEDMIDSLGNIIVEDTEIALPSSNFIDFNGNQQNKAISINIELI